MKNISGNTKNRIITTVILFLAVAVKIFFDSASNGLLTAELIATAAVTSVAFAAFIAVSFSEKGFNSLSGQSVLGAMAVLLAMGIVISYRLASRETLVFVLMASVAVICAQHFNLLAVAALIGVYAAFENYDYAAVSFIPAALGASLICLSAEVKNSAVWKKIVFAALNIVMICAEGYALHMRRYTITFHSLKTQIWDSFGVFAAVIILLALAVYAIIKKRPIGEIFGYVVAAGFGFIPAMMDMTFALSSAAGMFMMLTAAAKNGTAAELASDGAVNAIKSKLKKA